jgi:hypothetical protein
VFIAFDGKSGMWAINAAMKIIMSLKNNANKPATMDASGNDDKEEEPDTTTKQTSNRSPTQLQQKDCHLLLTLLWVVANGFSQNVTPKKCIFVHMNHATSAAAQSIAIFEGVMYIALQLTFGGSSNPQPGASSQSSSPI